MAEKVFFEKDLTAGWKYGIIGIVGRNENLKAVW